jgi:L-alanine-DL-glutamate epimerase-like enolase superfamily enzyme
MPLVVPYRLAFGVQDSFDCVIVRVTDETAREGWGEAALLPGYTDESAQSSWQTAKSVAPRLVGLDGAEALAEAERLLADAAFTACAFLTAMDHAAGHPALSVMGRQPLLGTVNGKPDDRAALTSEIEALIAAGYTTLKMKVGFDLSADLKAVAIIRDIVAGRALLRIDGNQGYAREDAVAFLSQLSPEGVELIEQPCAAHDWDAAVAVKQAASVPVMMDESIYGEDDIRRAADLQCADYIKLKLMKMGSLDRLARGLELVRSLGMRTVMGNGVASDLGCWMEACIGVAHLDNAGEMNGFLKPRQTLLKTPLRMEGPCVALDGSAMEVDEGKLSQLKTDHAAWGSRP